MTPVRLSFDSLTRNALCFAPRAGGGQRLIRVGFQLLSLSAVLLLSGCAAAPPGEGLLDKALGLVGLQQKVEAPPLPAMSPEMLKPAGPTKIALRVHASDLLNADASKRPLSLVMKLYKLKNYEEFLRVSYQDLAQGKDAGQEVIASREVVLIPGQRYEVEEGLTKDTAYLAVVALFKSPSESRWRFVFDVKESAKQGVTLGVHQCALSVAQGVTVGSSPESLRLAGTVCHP
jgi:type VI secretion system protein VasD